MLTGSARLPAATSRRVRRQAVRVAWLLAAAGALLLAAGRGAGRSEPAGAGDPWRELEPGLELGEFVAPRPSRIGDSIIRILRIDPRRFSLRLMSASALEDGRRLTARQWCRQHGLIAAINPSMFQADYRSSVSLMRTRAHVNNPRLSKDKAVLAFEPLDASVPPVQIIDRECQDLAGLREHYGTLVQSIRMVSCDGRNVWSPQARSWSTAAIGMDEEGRVLFIHVRSPYGTHDLIDILLELPIALRNAMYTEGGPEAQLYVGAGDEELEFVGSFEPGFNHSDANAIAWPIPNVVGVVRREE